MEMRQIFASCLERAMEEDERICVIDADLAKANGTLGLRKRFPDRAFDVGVAEQNMASVAAGLSSYGFIPFITSFATFASRRICDQLAVSGAYAGSNIKVVGSDPGISAELNGGTHMSVEDIGVLRSIPNVLIFEPADGVQLRKAIPQIIEHPGVVYMRLFRKEAADIFDESYRFGLLKADVLQTGTDVSILASGIMVAPALKAANLLAADGVCAEVIDVHTIKPIDADTILASARKTGAVLTCENHNIVGGLYSAVAECLAKCKPVPMAAIGIPDVFGEVGRLPELAKKFGMTAEDIVVAAKTLAAKKQSE